LPFRPGLEGVQPDFPYFWLTKQSLMNGCYQPWIQPVDATH